MMRITKRNMLAAGVALAGSVAIMAAPAAALAGVRITVGCNVVETRLNGISTVMQNTSARREIAYQNAVTRVTNELTTAKDAGYDTTQLQADYQTLNNDIKTFHAERVALESDIQAAATLAPTGCGDSQGQFVGDLQTARQQLQVVRAADRTIRQQLTGHVLPDLQAYSKWLQQQAASADVHADAGASVTAD